MLIIAEKPNAAARIASALATNGRSKAMFENGVPYHAAKRNNETIVVVPALGHLYTVASKKKDQNSFPTFAFYWVPKYLAPRGKGKIRTWLRVISKLAQNADKFIDACDYDLEGSIIGYSILKYACGNKETVAKRMKYSTLTKEELEKSYEELLPSLDFALIEAGLARHEVDWLYGINLSRAMTLAAKKQSGKYSAISTGRVQGPTLKFLAIREREIKSFVPIPHWSIRAEFKFNDLIFSAEYEKSVFNTKKDAEHTIASCKGKLAEINRIEEKELRKMPPLPFDFGDLQGEAYRLFKYSPVYTSRIAQRLYLDALISYPRTSSQKLPPNIGYRKILKKLATASEYQKSATKLLAKKHLEPSQGKKEDSAHPAIYPTGNLPNRALNRAERNLLDLIIKRFMAVFCDPARLKHLKILIDVNGKKFHVNSRQILEEGWLHSYKPYSPLSDSSFPQFFEGQKIEIRKTILEDRFSEPPSRFNSISLLRRMEKEGIGTNTTRAEIIQTLYRRKYIREERIEVTQLGFDVYDILREFCPKVISIELTEKLEERLSRIQKRQETRQKIIDDTIEFLEPILTKLKQKEKIIGEKLSQAIAAAKQDENTIGSCPNCLTGKLIILRSRKTRKRFVGCTNYFDGKCNTAFPLPQHGSVNVRNKTCKECGYPIVNILQEGKREWALCIDPKCPTKDKWRTKFAV